MKCLIVYANNAFFGFYLCHFEVYECYEFNSV